MDYKSNILEIGQQIYLEDALTVDKLTNNVGIGTTSPGAKLDVTDGSIQLSTSGSGVYFGSSSAAQIIGVSGASSYLALGTVGSERLRITSAGNVGIGTTSPSQALEVVGNIKLGDGGQRNIIGALNNSLGIYASPNANNEGIIFSTDNGTTAEMFIQDGGNVGIGTTSPAYKLDIAGDAQIQSAFFLRFANEWGIQQSGTNLNFAEIGSADGRLYLKAGGNVGIGTTSPAASLHIGATGGVIFGATAGAVGTAQITTSSATSPVSTRFAFGTDGSGWQYRIAKNTAGTIVDLITVADSGNVGIGTTSPAQKLDVAGTVRTTGTLGSSSGSYSIDHQGVNTWKIGITATNTSTFHIGNDTGGAFVNKILNITSAGNVGIGTTSPSHKLQVVGAGTFASTTTTVGVNVGLYLSTGGSTSNYNGILFQGVSITDMYLGRAAGAGVDDLIIRGASELVRFKANGNVGIGTTTPSASLHVQSGSTKVFLSNTDFASGSTGSGLILNTGAQSGNTYSQIYAFQNGNASYANLVVPGGNVGIGTTSPVAKLQIGNGTSNASNRSSVAILSADGGNAVLDALSLVNSRTAANGNGTAINFHNANNYSPTGRIVSIQDNGTNASLRFSVYNSTDNQLVERITLLSSGNVGIGTTSPGSLLQLYKANADAEIISERSDAGTGARYVLSAIVGGSTRWRFATIDTNSFATFVNGSERMRITSTGNVGIGTTSPSVKLHVIGNVTVSATLLTENIKLTGTLTDSFSQVGTPGQVLSSTGTGVEWVTGGGGGGGSTIVVKDEGTTIGSSFTTLNFIGDNVNATASGSTAVIEVSGRASTGSVYYEDLSTPFVIPGGGFAAVEINAQTVMATVPSLLTGSNKLMATITFGVSNVSTSQAFNGFQFRLYNVAPMYEVQGTTHSWNGYMSKDEGCTTTVFTFHIPIDYNAVNGGDTIVVQADTLPNYTPEIYYCALTLMEGTN
jgi:hypothetical protein